MYKNIALFLFLVFLVVFSSALILLILIVQFFRYGERFSDYVYICILGEDQKFSNYIYGRRGQDFYISSVAYYDAEISKKNIWFKNLIDWIFLKIFNEKDHCKRSYKKEIEVLGFLPELNRDGDFKRRGE